MPSIRSSLHTATGLIALALALPATAQDVKTPTLPELPAVGDAPVVAAPVAPAIKAPMSPAEVQSLPPEYRRLPVDEEVTTRSFDADGVETITRTRRIVSAAPVEATTHQTATSYQVAPGAARTRYVLANPRPAYAAGYPGAAYTTAGYAPAVLDRASWIEECERRTDGRDKDDTGTIVGGLLGAIGGGILGNRLWDSERLAGTLIGGGVGGIAGLLIGSLFNGDKEEDLYDCEAALDTYLEQYGQNGAPRFASRVIAAPAPVAAPPAYAGYPAYGYSYAATPAYYQAPQTLVMVPVTTYQQQRVVVRETVREESVPVPAARTIPAPAPAPSPKMIKQAPAPVRAPAPSPKLIKR